MKWFFIFLLILLFSIWIGDGIVTDPGYLLIARHKIAIEMPLWLAVLGFIVSVIVIYFLIRIVHCFFILPKHWSIWLRNRQQQKQTTIEDQDLFTILYQKPKNCVLVLKILPELTKKTWLSQAQIKMLEHDCYENLVKEAIHTNFTKFAESWKLLPNRFKKDTSLLSLYVRGLIHYHEAEQAELLTRKLLKRQWLRSLVQAYGLIRVSHPERQLAHAEKWLKQHPYDPDLLLTLGRLCKQLQLWGKAKDYLTTSLLYAPSSSEAYQELGGLFEELGESMQTLQCYKKALDLLQNSEI
jgi:uncharacterized protein HemY